MAIKQQAYNVMLELFDGSTGAKWAGDPSSFSLTDIDVDIYKDGVFSETRNPDDLVTDNLVSITLSGGASGDTDSDSLFLEPTYTGVEDVTIPSVQILLEYEDEDDKKIHVAKTGSDSNTGTGVTNARLTVSQAISDSIDGDTIFIWPGTYIENITLTKSIKIEGANRENCILYGNNNIALTLSSDGVYLCNLTVSIHEDTLQGTLIATGQDRVTIENCIIDGGSYGLLANTIDGLIIKDSIITANGIGMISRGSTGVFISNTSFSGIRTSDSSNTVITGCQINSNAVFDNCSFTAEFGDIDRDYLVVACSSNHTSGAYDNNLVFNNCSFIAKSFGSNHTGPLKGFEASPGTTGLMQVTMNNCSIKTMGGNNTTVNYGVYADQVASTSNTTIVLNGCSVEAWWGTSVYNIYTVADFSPSEDYFPEIILNNGKYGNQFDWYGGVFVGSDYIYKNWIQSMSGIIVEVFAPTGFTDGIWDNMITELIDADGRVRETRIIKTSILSGATAILTLDKIPSFEWDNGDSMGVTTKYSRDSDIVDQTDQLEFDDSDPSGTKPIVATLTSTGLDNILATEPTGRATTFREMIVQLWMRFFNKVEKTSSDIIVYDEGGSGAVTTQGHETVGTTTTVDEA